MEYIERLLEHKKLMEQKGYKKRQKEFRTLVRIHKM